MVSQEREAANTTSSSILHDFLISDSITSQTQFENPHSNPYECAYHVRGSSNTYSVPFGGFTSIQSLGERMSRSINLVHDPTEPEMGHSRHAMDLFGAPDDLVRGSNPLSISLGSQAIIPPMRYRQRIMNPDLHGPSYLIPGEETSNPGNYSFIGTAFSALNANRPCSNTHAIEPFSIRNSVYLKPAQSLLEKVVNVGGKDVELSEVKRLFLSGKGLASELRAELFGNGLLPSDMHDLQIKISKLITLLEQVENRYEEYCQRMEELITSYEVITGGGGAKCYTALALQAMCRHFCSLRDSILSQIKDVRKKLFPDLPKIRTGLSQLCLFDRETRQNRIPLQQIGLMQGQRHAWRPIRGLPETSVTILRAWLFEHFLHPYPNDSEKLVLASQTGLTKNQVSNWFINARVRLWKPMIEEMYKEEFGDSSVDSPGDGFGSE